MFFRSLSRQLERPTTSSECPAGAAQRNPERFQIGDRHHAARGVPGDAAGVSAAAVHGEPAMRQPLLMLADPVVAARKSGDRFSS